MSIAVKVRVLMVIINAAELKLVLILAVVLCLLVMENAKENAHKVVTMSFAQVGLGGGIVRGSG